ncbi:GIGYF family protein Gyf [Calliphora vicina]|uniref:GIGYF family protein Gyf n=1 Tax=Calliphora vicina TaxID=7373 RepID=UPI00325B67BD
MTDSMKFGPEWLRNMSADTTSSNSVNTSGQLTNPTGVFGSGSLGGGVDGGTSVNNANSNSSNLNPSSFHNNVNAANSGASRNTFPEFRYGREEMLLLFDRNCGIPDILPSCKNLFVERVQFPLALVPSTDEDMMQGTAPPTQRPGWLQRSPVGFNTATRGTGRVGCMERGRMRGKSIYHPVFQRPNALFDDDQRSSAIKTDRSWVERNGGAVGDPVVAGPSTVVGGGLGAEAWNGNTPVSSPRREFSNHPRNMENWRRSRNEDGSGGEASTTTFTADSGWRMNTGSGFQNSHTRWGRSTSWRDDELANNNENSGMVGSSATTIAGGGGGAIMMLRSNSAISTTQGHPSVSGKQTGAPGVPRSISVTSSGTRNTVSGNIWPNSATVGQMSNMQGDGCVNDELALPEWAMENPSDIGGTFDASGAFHGAVDDDIHTGNIPEEHDENDLPEQTSDAKPSDTDVQENVLKTSDDNSIKSTKSPKRSSLQETDNYQDSSSPSPTPTSNVTASHENTDNSAESEKSKPNNNSTQNPVSPVDVAPENVSQKNSEHHSENEYIKESATNCNSNLQNYSTRASSNEENTTNSNVGDYAERMMKVTDDMIEKLIMDDEDAKDDHMKSSMLSGGNKRNAQHVFVSALQQPQNSNHQSTVSAALSAGAGPTGPPNMSLYNMGGMMVDHTHNMAALHQLQQQQMAAVAAAAIGLQPTPPPPPHPMTSSGHSELWLYRDPQAKVQGPFSALEMTEWYRAGYFNENLFVSRVCDTRFRPLGELIKICNGQMPFSHSHLIPIDLNSTPLTPPLAPVISAQPSAQATATDYVIKTLNEHQQHQQHEKLKGNVTAAADSLSNALKSLINSVDISQVLNMHFQTLQDRFIHNQEIEISNELSKNECFRRLTAAEQDAVVRQKLQMMVLPEYLTNLTGLSNSLAALNPTAGTQLYDTIAECTKKEQLFCNHQGQPQSQTTAQQQQRSNHHASSSGAAYINTAEDFIMKTKNAGHDMNSNDLLNEFNLRMFLNNGSDSGTGGGSVTVATTNSHGHEFLNDQQLFGAGATSTPNPPTNTSQSPMMQMWMNSLSSNQTNQLPTQQHPLMGNAQQAPGINNQWLNGPLVGIPSINLSREQHGTSGSIMGSPKPTPASMWDVATLEQHVQVQQQLQQQMQQQSFEHHRHLKDTGKHPQDQQQLDIDKNINKQQQHQHSEDINQEQQQQQQMSTNDLQKSHDGVTKISSTNNNNNSKQEQQQRQPLQPTEKSQSHVNNNKRNVTNNNIVKPANKAKNENFVEQISKKTEEERRRELNEEKRRQKEERKRQQLEEEKRRLMQAEEEKRRQMQEEEKRQQQIQAQRRKALMSSTNNNNSPNNNSNNSLLTSPNSTNNVGNPKSKEHQHIQSSVAPWSTQTMATKSQGPGLAEIQKAERRERRADQQRQLEIQEKQMRALAAASEAQDTILKWNAAPVPVKSFAEIQAEEAKRLAHEQMELQRRKEQEVHNNLVAFSSAGSAAAGGLSSSSNISSIWSGNKIWGTPSSNTTGFWEEPLKFNSKSISACLSNSNSNNLNNNNNSNLTAALIVAQSSTIQQKQTTSQQHHQHPSSQQPLSKNIKKSQSVAVMQNTVSPPTASTSGGPNIQKKPSSNTTPSSKQAKPQKADNNGAVCLGNENKKSTTKNNNAAIKGDDYEAEFTNWCTKSLNNMNTKVDVPTFVSFLRDLESPYEVKDYIRMYLGESKEYIDFAKQFLERRSKYKNLQRAQNAHDDDLCKPALAITPSVNDNSDNKGKQKKIKKSKMTKLDARILGFSVTAAEGRINVGDRDYGDAP